MKNFCGLQISLLLAMLSKHIAGKHPYMDGNMSQTQPLPNLSDFVGFYLQLDLCLQLLHWCTGNYSYHDKYSSENHTITDPINLFIKFVFGNFLGQEEILLMIR